MALFAGTQYLNTHTHTPINVMAPQLKLERAIPVGMHSRMHYADNVKPCKSAHLCYSITRHVGCLKFGTALIGFIFEDHEFIRTL
jgi:hypothetical protein